MQTDSLADKAKIVKLQSELLQSKDTQLQSMQAVVENTVQTTVSKEIKQYSDVVAKQKSAPVMTQQSLTAVKKVVKKAIEEEDRSRKKFLDQLIQLQSRVKLKVRFLPKFKFHY